MDPDDLPPLPDGYVGVPPLVATDEEGSDGMTEGPVDLQEWYRTKVTELNLEPYEMAEQIRRSTEHIPFSAALEELQVESQCIQEEVSVTA